MKEEVFKHLAQLSEEQRTLLEMLLRQEGVEIAGLGITPRRKGQNAVPLSFAQQRLWFLDQLEPGNPSYNSPIALRLQGALHVQALECSLRKIIQRHESLRTTFISENGEPLQVILPDMCIQWPLLDVRPLTTVERSNEIRRLASEEALQPFNLSTGPLLRAWLLRLDEQEHVLLLNMHHIITDAWSANILCRELSILYEAYIQGVPASLPELPIQYADFALWQRQWLQGEVLAEQVAYWRQQLEGAPAVLHLPGARTRPEQPTYRGAFTSLGLSRRLTGQLEALGQSEGATLFMTLLAVFQVLLARYSGQTDIVVGVPVANRVRSEIEDQVGFFINTLALRARLVRHNPFRATLAHVRNVVLEAFAHQDLPFERLVEELGPERDLSHPPLFQVMFNMRNFVQERFELPGLTLAPLDVYEHIARFDLTLYAEERDQAIELHLLYSTDLFEQDAMSRLLGHMQTLLEAVVAQPDQQISLLPLLTSTETRIRATQGNSIQPTTPFIEFEHACLQGTIPERFASQVRRYPQHIAIKTRTFELTYAQLDHQARQVAHALLARDTTVGERVALLFEHDAPMLVALMGALQAGKVYVPIDPTHPQERIAAILDDAQATILLTSTTNLLLAQNVVPDTCHVMNLDEIWHTLTPLSPGAVEQIALAPESLAYIIYTSGSTGQPKGVVQTHRNVLHFMRVYTNNLHINPDDILPLFFFYNTDGAVMDIFGALLNGATLCPMNIREEDPSCLASIVNERGITIFHATPTVYRYFLGTLSPEQTFPRIRLVVLGGEIVQKKDIELYKRYFPRECLLINGLGPTESTVTLQYITDQQSEVEYRIMPAGYPVEETEVSLLTALGEQIAMYGTGEIAIRSPYLAPGYWGQAELTARTFLSDPGGFDRRIYLTGDIGRWLPDGSIAFVGRKDLQVKIRGYRVETGEIEVKLHELPAVKEAAVIIRRDADENNYLVAYVVPNADADLNTQALRSHLQKLLPDYMLPSAFVILEAFPMTPTGKVDRLALTVANLAVPAVSENAFVAPHTPTEELLAAIWGEVLRTEHAQIGIHDNFFALGGHSLLATQVVSRIKAVFQVETPLRRLFETPTIARLADQIEQARRGQALQAPPLQPASRMAELPLSFAQERLWFLDQLERESTAYIIPLAVRVLGGLDAVALERSLNLIVLRHEVLRTCFVAGEDGQPQLMIAPHSTLAFSLVDLQEIPFPEREEYARKCAIHLASQPFDLRYGPLFYASLLRLNAQEHVLLVIMHHIVSDAWSLGIFARELSALYSACSAGQPNPLPALPIQYADFAVWQRQWLQRTVREHILSYWRQQLSHLPLLELPTDYPRPAVQTFQGSRYTTVMPLQLLTEMKALSQRENVTLFMALLAAFNLLLAQYSQQEDIVTGTYVANRTRVELENLIGFFTNTLVLRCDLTDATSFREVVRRTREVTLGAFEHQDMPFEQLVETLQPERNLSHSPLCQVIFQLHNTPHEAFSLADLELRPFEISNGTAKFDLTLSLVATKHGLSGTWEYNTDLFAAATIERIARHYQYLLEGIIAEPARSLWDLPLMNETERRQVLVDWNATQLPYPAGVCLHTLVEEQVERTPEAVALVYRREHITYQELNARAAALARYLQHLGVGPEVCVGLYLERSLEMVIGLLAVLKAGGAYVPLDPGYPQERLTFMLEDARIAVLLTQNRLLSNLSAHGARVVYLDTDWETIATLRSETPVAGVRPENLAYVIYTSGSTGQPKGVMVNHATVVNFFTAMDQRIGSQGPGRWLAITSISFDISVLELVWTLTRGFQVVIQGEMQETRAAAQTHAAVADQKIDFSLFYFASDESEDDRDKYRLLIEGARFADQHGFSAIWTPERHFHAFGGLYPNPALTGTAIAMITKSIHIRAGSVVLPLHNALRVAEEWAVVDNLSGGRVGISFASGWHAHDFVLEPRNYAERKAIMLQQIDVVRRLWRGEACSFQDGAGHDVPVKIHPRPLQRELPAWITSSGNRETFRAAGQAGANLLTHLLGQSIEDLAEKIAIYRQAWQEHGHGPGTGHVTLMLHTFVGEDDAIVREKVREPFCNYLKTSLDLIEGMARDLDMNMYGEDFTDDDLHALLSYAFERYYETSGLFGTPVRCLRMVDRLKRIGVDEIACLIDFGVDFDSVISSLLSLNRLKEYCDRESAQPDDDYSLTAQLGQGITHLQCTPSMARVLIQDATSLQALGSLQQLLLGGESLPASLAEQLSDVVSGELHNMYGPTETTIWSTEHLLRQMRKGVPIGRPIANTQVYLLDRRLQPVPPGVPGELYIGGYGVARGYLRRPEWTAERFIPDPFTDKPGQRLYWTGDVARYLPDGEIEYLGRVDQQVKVRGHRIEPGEIEARLEKHSGVREAAVIVREDEPGNPYLTAYITGQSEQQPSMRELRDFLQAALPEYMVPTLFIFQEELPRTPNGKLDRKVLARLERSAGQASEAGYSAPRTQIEELLAGVWAEVLRHDSKQISIFDDFFMLGGHSLSATRAIARIRKIFQVDIPLRRLFEKPTIAELAGEIELAQRDRQPLPILVPQPAVQGKEVPLSFAQERLWFLDRLLPSSTAYINSRALHLRGPLHVAALVRSLREIVHRHESLRTTFHIMQEQPMQVVTSPETLRDMALPCIDLERFTVDKRETIAQDLFVGSTRRAFDLQHDRLLRAQLLRLHAQEHVLLVNIHHIASDGWSLAIFEDELGALYTAFAADQPSPLAPLPVQYPDFARWQRQWLQGARLAAQTSYWRYQLANLPVLNLPADYPRPAIQTFRGSSYTFQISKDYAEQLNILARHESVTLFMLLLSAFLVLLSRYSGQEDIVVGTYIANRTQLELENLIGFFANTLVLRADLSGMPGFSNLLKHIRNVVLEAYAYQDMPFERLVEELQPVRDLSRNPLCQVMFQLHNEPRSQPNFGELTAHTFIATEGVAKFDLSLEFIESSQGLLGRFEYNTDLFEVHSIHQMAQCYRRLLEGIVANPLQRISDLPLLDAALREQMLVSWNATWSEYQECSLHELFDRQAERSPTAVALIYQGMEVRYADLQRKANQLANFMRRQGVGQETRVGICIERSVEMVIGLLGILKAGGAYVPLDPAYPRDRLAFMLEDAQAPFLLTTREQLAEGNVPTGCAHVICLDSDWPTIAAESELAPACDICADNLAYVIYTSGSSGIPKGVLGLHRGAVNRYTWMCRTYPFASDEVCAQKTALSFVDAVWEVWGPLLSGIPLVLIPDEVLKDPRALISALAEYAITRIVLVPSLLRVILDSEPELAQRLPHARYWISSGEALSSELQRRFREQMPGRVLLNLYGSSEVAADVTCYEVKEHACASGVPIGRPIDNTHIYLLDAHLQPVPVGVWGRLYVSGAGLARGYLNQPALTTATFIPDPFCCEPGQRMYDTGDTARYLPDGIIEYSGRSDQQVKLYGHRIEPGEIEALLSRHPHILQAVVLLQRDTPEEQRLVAYVVPNRVQIPAASELRSFLQGQVPNYMLPAAFVYVEALPLTPSGKIDRLALAKAGGQVQAARAASYAPPQNATERAIAHIWQDMLHLEKVGKYDNFFELGGNSLLLTRVQTRIHERLQKDLEVLDLFKYPTISTLAAFLTPQDTEDHSWQRGHTRAQTRKELMKQNKKPGQRRQQTPENR